MRVLRTVRGCDRRGKLRNEDIRTELYVIGLFNKNVLKYKSNYVSHVTGMPKERISQSIKLLKRKKCR
jgi:hypothetical protein